MRVLSQKEERQRKFMLVLPLITVPFLIMFFWAMGGGKNATAQSNDNTKGLNMHLPDAHLKEDKKEDKLSFYQQAEKDSLRLKEQMSNDPYYKTDTTHNSLSLSVNAYSSDDTIETTKYSKKHVNSRRPRMTSIENNEAKINERLNQLNEQVNQNDRDTLLQKTTDANDLQGEKLDAMMKNLNTSATQNDPEMDQLNGMLENILDIEHPERAREKIRLESLKNKKQVYALSMVGDSDPVETFHGDEQNVTNPQDTAAQKEVTNALHNGRNDFYDSENMAQGDHPAGNSVEAVVEDTRVLTTGATIKLKLNNDIAINGIVIPKDQYVYGTCGISEDRLLVTVSSIRYNNSILPVALQAYDMDGIAGIYIPGAITRDVAKNTAGETVQGLDVYAFDNSLKGQAASTGVQAAKSLLSKKAKLIKVTVKAGYQLLLKDTNSQN